MILSQVRTAKNHKSPLYNGLLLYSYVNMSSFIELTLIKLWLHVFGKLFETEASIHFPWFDFAVKHIEEETSDFLYWQQAWFSFFVGSEIIGI